MRKKFIAYEGEKLVVEWYFNDKGRSEAKEYFKELTLDRMTKTLYLFRLLADSGKVFNAEKFRYEGDQIYAIKSSADRFLCFFFEGAKVIITNAYEKKSAKMPQKEKQKALKMKDAYIKRYKQGTYYD